MLDRVPVFFLSSLLCQLVPLTLETWNTVKATVGAPQELKIPESTFVHGLQHSHGFGDKNYTVQNTLGNNNKTFKIISQANSTMPDMIPHVQHRILERHVHGHVVLIC